jgi:outer membrane protein TolC
MKRTLKRILIPVISIFSLLPGKKGIAQTGALTMKQAVEIALANNTSLKADSMNLLVTGYQNNILRSDFLPQVNYSAKTEYNLALAAQMVPGNLVNQPSKDYVPVQFGTRYSTGSGIEVTQSIINKSSRIKLNAAGLNTSIAQTKHRLTKEELVYQVAATYYVLQANAEMIRTTTRDYLNLKEILSIAKAQYENGILKKIDYESIEINTANKESYLNQLQTDYNDLLANFNYLMGIPAESRTVIETNVSTISATLETGDLFSQRADVYLSNQLIESKEVEIRSIRAEKKPVLNSFFRFNYQAQFNDAGKAFNHDYWSKSSSVGISTSISLFDGYRRKNRLNIAQSQLDQLKFQNEQAKQLANKEWVTALGKLGRDRQQYEITTKNLQLAEKVFASRKALYAEGVTTLVELLDAESELSQSRNLHIQSIINLQTSLVNIYKAKGTLLTEFLKTI